MDRKKPGKMTISVLAAAAFVFLLSSWCAPADDLGKAAATITGEIFSRNNAIRTIQYLADEIGPRLTGSEAAHRATAHCLGLFKQYGLTNIHTETFEIPGWIPGPISALAEEPFKKALRVDSLGFSINTPAQGLLGEVVDVGHGTQEDYEKAGPAIKGRIVLAGLLDPSDPSKATKEWQKVDFAAKKGAAACLIIAGTRGGLTRTRASNYGGYSTIPAASVAYEDGAWMRRRLEAGKALKVKLLMQNTLTGKAKAENVVADIPGTGKSEEMVILGAHLDSWFLGPGAADNALGVSIALEAARVLSAPGLAPKRRIRFVLFSGEEEGLLGSFEYAKSHESELDKVVLMVNLDMTGLMYPGVLNPYGACPIADKLKEVLPVLAGLGVTQVEARYPYDSDDFNFIARGVPALGVQGRGVRDWSWGHSYADTFEKIEADRLNMNAASVATVIYFAATRPEALSRRLPQADVVRYFKERNLDKVLKQEGTWKKLGFPEE